MKALRSSSTAASRNRAFTLIEILVVVAIIALLVSILMPALKQAKEQSKATVCLSNLKQQGTGYSSYSTENKQKLPIKGYFSYQLMTGLPGQQSVWVTANTGGLFPKYTGREAGILFCPSNEKQTPQANVPKLKTVFANPRPGTPLYPGGANNPGNAPIGAYRYGLPAVYGKSPCDKGRDMYPLDVMCDNPTDPDSCSPYRKYQVDPQDQTAAQEMQFLGPFKPGTRGKYNIQTLVADPIGSGYEVWHVNGINALYSDFHAKKVPDPSRKLYRIDSSDDSYADGGNFGFKAKQYIAWDYISKHY